MCGAGSLASSPPPDGLAAASWTLTFWICAACSFTIAVRVSIPDFSCAMAASCSSFLRCSLRNSFEQHRVHCFVAHGVHLCFGIASYQVGVHLFHFLSHKAKLRNAIRINQKRFQRDPVKRVVIGFIDWLDDLGMFRGPDVFVSVQSQNDYRYLILSASGRGYHVFVLSPEP